MVMSVMTENKRFKYKESEKEDICGIYDDKFVVGFGYKYRGSVKAICNLLNSLYDENKQLKKELKDYSDANADLEERNKRQATRLSNLYDLIEKEDWTTLKSLIEEFEEAERLNQMEFQAYCGDKDE